MRRSALAVGLAALSVIPAQALEPSPEELLGSLFYTLAVVEYCGLEPDEHVGRSLAKAGYRLQVALGLDNERARAEFGGVKLRLVAAPPDCGEGSPDIAGIVQFLNGDLK